MKKNESVVVAPRIDRFTFDLPFPAYEAGTVRSGLAGFLAGCAIPSYRTDERSCELMQVDLTGDRVADVELVEGIPGRDAPALRIDISPDGIEEGHLEELGHALSLLLGEDFESMCGQARAVAMNVSVSFANASLDRVIPRLYVSGRKVREDRTFVKDGRFKRIRFETKACNQNTSATGEFNPSDNDAMSMHSDARRCFVHDDTLLSSKVRGSKRGGDMSLHQQYTLDLSLAELSSLQSGFGRIRFAEAPFEDGLGLPEIQAREFLDLIRSKGVNVAIARSLAWDGGEAAEHWWDSRQAKWWNAAEVWHECVADLPRIGNFIASGFTRY